MPAGHSDSDSGTLKQYRDPELATSETGPIGFYEREFYVLSNFSSFAVHVFDRLWPTAEHAYQASKFMGSEDKRHIVSQIFQARSAHSAFKLAKEEYVDQVRDDWTEEKKLKAMKEVCWNKLVQHEYVQRKLMQTANRRLVEDSPKDDFWGWGPDEDGRNELGKIWMHLRKLWRYKLENNIAITPNVKPNSLASLESKVG